MSGKKLFIFLVVLMVFILTLILVIYQNSGNKFLPNPFKNIGKNYEVDTGRALQIAEKLSYRQKKIVVKKLDKPSDRNGVIARTSDGAIFVNSFVNFDEDEIFLELYISDEYLKKTVAEMKASDIKYSKMLAINRIIVGSFLRSSIAEDLRSKDPVDVFPDLNKTIDSDAMILRL